MDEDISLPHHYNVFLLRFWNESFANPQTGLRLMLIDLRTGQKWGFVSLERLFDFLEQKIMPDDGGVDDA